MEAAYTIKKNQTLQALLLKGHLFMTDNVHVPHVDHSPPPGPDREAYYGFSRDPGYRGDFEPRVVELVHRAMTVSGGQYDRLPPETRHVLNMYIEWRIRDGSLWADMFHWTSYLGDDETKAHDYQGYFDSLLPYWQALLLEGAIIFGNAQGPDFERSRRPAEMPVGTGNPYIITGMSGNIENLTPWKWIEGGSELAAAMNYEGGDTSGYTACMWRAVWPDEANQGLWTQTTAQELLQDARDYFDAVIENVSRRDRRSYNFRAWRDRFEDAMNDLQLKINGQHPTEGPFH